jgi:hypothetical protein
MKIVKTLFFQSMAFVCVFAGFNVYAGDQSICNSGAKVELHNNGALKDCQLKNDIDANKIRCKNGSSVRFYPNGNLETCVLAAQATLGQNTCQEDGDYLAIECLRIHERALHDSYWEVTSYQRSRR